MSERAARPTRGQYPHHLPIPTRWMDNDAYGHVNNVVYYSFFDTAVNRYLIDEGGLDFANAPVIGIAVESQCTYFAPTTYPETVEAGLRVARLGTSSVTYELAIFGASDRAAAAAGRFVHVFVDRETMRAVPIPPPIRAALERIRVAEPG